MPASTSRIRPSVVISFETEAMRYRVFDVAGRSAVAPLPIRRRPKAPSYASSPLRIASTDRLASSQAGSAAMAASARSNAACDEPAPGAAAHTGSSAPNKAIPNTVRLPWFMPVLSK